MPKAEITIGADPEFFVVNEMDMELVTALDLVEGTKEKPLPLGSLPKEYNFHRDNVMIELGIPPTPDPYTFTDSINTAMMYANSRLQEKSDIGESFAIYRNIASWEFADVELADPRAQEFGCEPDQDAYEGGQERVAPGNVLGNWRTAGGHVHIGSDQGFNCPNFIVALLCDAYIGVGGPNEPAADPEASHMWYRRPGIYRDKPYGIEYRSPCNFWTFNNNQTFRTAARAKAVGAYCANTNATKIRKMIESIDWVYVRNKIMGGENNAELNHKHRNTIRELRAYGGE